jgi:putative CocE/NonD family hydrolase
MQAVGFLLWMAPHLSCSQARLDDAAYVRNEYHKIERMIPMRDGVRLFTAIYIPNGDAGPYPFLMERTPYSCTPYGEASLRRTLGPNPDLMREKYIFVYQDVRGRFRSEGQFEEMTPAVADNPNHSGVDESTDTYDSIEWLLKRIGNNNGRVGLYGISYPGFYASAALPNAHPAIRAVSPQAPMSDEFIGDDANHHGAFFLMDNFEFTDYFDATRADSGKSYKNLFPLGYRDAYAFYLGLGPLKNSNGPKYFDDKAKIWNEYLEHDRYDSYWQARNIRPHLRKIKAAVLIVGGWFDAEDLFGSLHTYEAIEEQNPQNDCRLVMGPWTHGAWARAQWSQFGTYRFGENVNRRFHQDMETPFFNYYLKDKAEFALPEATIFETGSNQWKSYPRWPPPGVRATPWFFQDQRGLDERPPNIGLAFDEFPSDPSHPVPYSDGVFTQRNDLYMIEDQRFASGRPDVLSFESRPLAGELVVDGRVKADIFLSSTGTDADIVVKLIDVLAGEDSLAGPENARPLPAGYQRLVRAEVFRAKFRKSYEHPEALVPGQVSEIRFELNDIAHRFRKGHRILVQVQASWFPLVDRNPQRFLHIPDARPEDFQKAQVRIYRDRAHPSAIYLPILP